MTVIVLLNCGHWFREARPDDLRKPEDGELRVCGSNLHYPRKFPAVYLANRKLAEFLGSHFDALEPEET